MGDTRKLAEQMGVGNLSQLLQEQSELLQKAAKEKKAAEEREEKQALHLNPGESLHVEEPAKLMYQYSEGKRQDGSSYPPYISPPQQAVHQYNTQQLPPSHHPAGQHVAYAGRPDVRYSPDPSLSGGLGVGSPVQLVGDPSRTGVIRWTGKLLEVTGYIAGVELVSYYMHLCTTKLRAYSFHALFQDGPMEGCEDGVWRGHRYFTCLPGRAFFCPITSLLPDPRVPQASQVGGASTGNRK